MKIFKELFPNIFTLLSILSVPDEGYSRNVLCTLNLISTFLLAQRYYELLSSICLHCHGYCQTLPC